MDAILKTLPVVYLVWISIFHLQTVRAAIITLPRSPCPGVFTYNTTSVSTSTSTSQTPDRWLGEILIKADTTLSGFWIDVELDKTAHLLGNYIAEVTSSDNQEFKIQDLDRRLAKGSITPVKIYVKYDPSSLPPPAVRVIRLNGRQICPPDHEEEIVQADPVRTTNYDGQSYSNRPQSSSHKAQTGLINTHDDVGIPQRGTQTSHIQSSNQSPKKNQNVRGYDEVEMPQRGSSSTQTSYQQNSSQLLKKNQNTRGASYDDVSSTISGTSTQTNQKNAHNNYQNNKPSVYDDVGMRDTVTQLHHPSGNSKQNGQTNTAQSSYEDSSLLQRGTMKAQTNKPQHQQTHHQTPLSKGAQSQQGFVASRPSNNAYDEVGIRAGSLFPGVQKSTPPPARTLSTMSVNHRNTQTTRQEPGHRVTQPTRPTIPERNFNDNNYDDSNIRGGGSNSNRDRVQSSWNKESTIERGTQTTSSLADDYFRGPETSGSRGSNRQQEPNYGGSRDDVYSSGSNRDRTPSRDPQYDDFGHERVGIRGSGLEFANPRPKERDRDNVFRGNANPKSDFDIENPQRGGTRRGGSEQGTRGSNSDWDDTVGSQKGSQSHRGSGGNGYNDRDETTVYTSLDSQFQRPTYTTTERYQPYPITPHPSSQFRPGHTPLSNSNSRPSEPSSDDYYEWGVRRTSSRRTQLPAPQPNTNKQPEQCGKIAVQPVALISRGTPTKSGDYPWHAAIYRPEGIDLRYICGATLVSLSTLVTAAHCVTRQSTGRAVKPDSLVVYLGKHSLRRWTGNEQTATVSEVIIHPAYNHTAFQADLALLKLSTPVTYNDYVRPVCLWDRRRKSIESVVARRGTVVGWGYDEYQVVTDELMQAQMPVVPKLDCIHSYPTFFSRFVTDLTYCAGFRNGTTACNGDSGGGMVFLEEPINPEDGDDGVWRLRGVVSIGVSITDQFVCDYNHYIVFTDVAQFLPWLESNM